MGAVAKPVELELDDILIEGGALPLVPPGEYSAQYIRHETKMVFGTPKVFIWFKIVEPGQAFGKDLYRPFRVKALVGKPGRNGRIKLGRQSELFLVLCQLYEHRQMRPDRISLRDLQNVILRVKVRTVDRDYKQRPRPEMTKYSVVGDILGVDVGRLPTRRSSC